MPCISLARQSRKQKSRQKEEGQSSDASEEIESKSQVIRAAGIFKFACRRLKQSGFGTNTIGMRKWYLCSTRVREQTI
jgi:hypothetical protein